MSALFSPMMPQAPEVRRMDERWTELRAARSQHEQMWEEIARLIRPQRGGFMSDSPGDRTLEKPLSSAPIMAQSNFAAGLYGTLTNPANQWFSFATPDDSLNAWEPAREWLDKVTKVVTQSLLPSVSPFYSAATQLFADIATFGNAAQYDEAVPEEGRILDVTVSLAEICVDIDGHGRVNEVIRRFKLKPRAALSMFGADRLPAKLAELAEKGSQDQITFWHHVTKNEGLEPGRLGARGKRWLSRYGCEIDQTLVREGGYDEMPFFFPRWEVDTSHIYGTGPGFVSLASARVLTQMEAATIRMAQRVSDPTYLVPSKEDWPLAGRMRPGGVIYAGTNMQGNPMVHTVPVAGGFNLTLQERQAKLEEIKDAFHYTLMQIAGRTGMTATEVMTINEERQRLWAPHQGRVQEEYSAPKLARRFSILWRAGQLPPPPKGMEGMPLQVTYQSAAAAAQLSANGNAVIRILQDVAPLIGVMPRLLDRLDPDGLLETLIAARGVPAAVTRSRDEADQVAQARAQQQQMAQAMAMAQQGAGAMKDGAQAMSALQGAMGPGADAGQESLA